MKNEGMRLPGEWMAQAQMLLDSFNQVVGRDLLPRSCDAEDEARRLFLAPFAVVSHGTEADPLLNYGNRAALELWRMEPESLIGAPSRLTAEPIQREARERLLGEVARDGFVSGYEGIRISATGRRFMIHDVTVWNVTDGSGRDFGQAATFARWTMLS